MRWDLHTHYYPEAFFRLMEQVGGAFSRGGSWATSATRSRTSWERMDNGWRDFAECRVNIDELPGVYLKRLDYDTVSFSTAAPMMTRELVGADHMVMGHVRSCSAD